MKNKGKIFVSAILCFLMLLPSVQASLVDDGYHFKDYEDSPNVADYGEWWYFNFYQADAQGVIQYSLWDPANLTDTHYGLMYVAIFHNDATFEMFFPIPWDYIITSETSADLTMGPNTITVLDGAYNLQGFVFDMEGNTIAWNLMYLQDKPSLHGLRNFKIYPPDPNEEMNWYVQMPSAIVSGVVVVNDMPIPINARGYHDHNWGVWKLYHGLWNWFQTNDPSLAIVGYDFYTLGKGEITLQVEDTQTTFKRHQYMLINYDWTLDPEVLQFFPKRTLVIAFNGKYCLILNITTRQTSLIGRIYAQPPTVWLVFESTAHFRGRIFGPGLCVKIDTYGFREYVVAAVAPPM